MSRLRKILRARAGRRPLLRLALIAIGAWVWALGCGAASSPATYDDVMEEYGRYRGRLQDVPGISVDEVLALNPGHVLFVDVRDEDERRISWIPGSVTREVVDDSLSARAARGDTTRVVAYCTIGYRSGKAVRELTRRGIDAVNLSGSILAWVHRGQSVVDSVGVTSRVHVYGRRWNLVPAGYEAVW